MNEENIKLPITITTQTGNLCTLELIAEKYVMTGKTGTHKLSKHCTNKKRLLTHWKGFVCNNGGFEETSLTREEQNNE